MITYAELQEPHYHYPGQAGSLAKPRWANGNATNGLGLGVCDPSIEGHYPGQYPSHVHLTGLGRGLRNMTLGDWVAVGLAAVVFLPVFRRAIK